MAQDAPGTDFPPNDVYSRTILAALGRLKEEGIAAVVFGDIFLEDLRAYRERLLGVAGLEGRYPLWGRDTAGLLDEFLALGFEAVVVCADEGRLPLAALQEMGAARLFRDADPGGPAAVVARLNLSGGEAALAQQVATETDGALRCLVISRNGVTSQVSWVHTDGGWSGLEPDPDGSGRRMVRLEPAAREDLGTWVAPAVAGAL